MTEVTKQDKFDEDTRRPERRDKLRNVPRVRIGVECATSGLAEAGYCFPLGYSEAVIYEDELPKLQSMIETEIEKIELAKKYVEDEHAEFEKAGKSPELREYENWTATFRRMNRREPRPFRSIKVLGQLAPPKTEEEKKLAIGTDQLVDALSKLLSMSGKSDKASK